MIELVYVSRSKSRLVQEELLQLLQQCRRNNQRSQISGLLLYDSYGTFIQALEGPEEAVDTLFMHIQKDPRHDHIHVLGKRAISSKSFADWKMGFRTLSPELIGQIDGFSDFLNRFKYSTHFALTLNNTSLPQGNSSHNPLLPLPKYGKVLHSLHLKVSTYPPGYSTDIYPVCLPGYR